MDLEPGQTIGDYEVQRILGAGGMEKVYQVRNNISHRVEAMKVLLPCSRAMPQALKRGLTRLNAISIKSKAF